MSTTSTTSHLRFVMLGLPTWCLVDGTWSALSQLAESVPEGYNISTYLMLALTLGNCFPILIGSCCLGSADFNRLHKILYVILFIGLGAGLGLAFTWNMAVLVQHVSVSVPLYLFFFIAGACATLSNVTHFTFVSHWPAANTSWLAAGMGLGTMSSGFLALIQGLNRPTGDPRFSVTTYYAILSLFYVPAILSLRYLNDDPTSDSKHVQFEKGYYDPEPVLLLNDSSSSHSGQSDDNDSNNNNNRSAEVDRHHTDLEFVKLHYPYLLFQLINATIAFGLVPSFISTVCSKFPNSSSILLLATSLSAVIDPLFRAGTLYVRISRFSTFCASVTVIFTLGTFLFVLLWLPDGLPIFNAAMGLVAAAMYATINALNVFTNTSVFLHFKANLDEQHMQQCYRLGGVATQIGSVVGTLLGFGLVAIGAV